MRYLAVAMVIAAALAEQQALAHPLSTASEPTIKQIEAIIHGKGKPGDTVVSASDPSISYTVLDNGLIKRSNARFGTSEVRAPVQDGWRDHQNSR